MLELLKLRDLPPDLLEEISAKAEGNPFFIEELIRMLINSDVLRLRDGRWERNPAAEVRYLSVPQNLQDLIMARYDHLSESLKCTLATAAVIGRSFYLGPLLRVLPGVTAVELRRRLQELEAHYFVRHSEGEPDPEYSFVHTITRETIYNSMLRRTREELHRGIGEALEEQYAGRLDEHAEALAHHFQHSRRHEKAVEYLVRSGKKAAARYANDAARAFFSAARAALERSGLAAAPSYDQLAIFRGMGDVLAFGGDYAGAHSEYRGGLAIAERLEAAGEQASLLRRMAVTHRMRGEADEALEYLGRAIQRLQRAGAGAAGLSRDEQEAAAGVYDELGWLYFQQGRIDEAEANLRQALRFVHDSSAYGILAAIYGHLGDVSFRRAAWDEAERFVSESLRLHEILGDAVGQARCAISLGAISKLQGAWGRAIDYYHRAINILGKDKHQELLARAHGNLGTLLCDQGDLRSAEQHLSSSLRIAGQLNNNYQRALSLKNMGYYYLAAQQWPSAASFITQGLQLAQEIGARELTADMYAALGEVYLRQGQLEAAKQQTDQALAAAKSEGVESEQYARALRLAGMLQAACGAHDEAHVLLWKSISILQSLQNSYELAKSCYELGLLLLHNPADRPEGRQYLVRALDLFDHLPAAPALQRTREALARAA